MKFGTPEQREARRSRRRARNVKPLATPSQRLRAWVNALFVDHQILRLVYLNRHRLGRSAWRSAQPAPCQLRWFARRGVRTVVNLRGESEFGSYPLEREACAALGLRYAEAKLRSRELPSRAQLLRVAGLLEEIEYPALFHCKSGADRAGLMSAIYLLLREGATPGRARAQLSLRYLHCGGARTGVLGAMIDAYARDRAAAEARGAALPFIDWARDGYDPEAIAAGFRARRGWAFLVDRVLGRE